MVTRILPVSSLLCSTSFSCGFYQFLLVITFVWHDRDSVTAFFVMWFFWFDDHARSGFVFL